jgi:hypothetical protein
MMNIFMEMKKRRLETKKIIKLKREKRRMGK